MAARSPRRADPARNAATTRRASAPGRADSLETARYFIALRPDPPVREALARMAASLARMLHGRPVAADDIHLTLQFIGDAPRALEASMRAIVDALPAPPADVPLDALGSFGGRLVWIGPRRCPDDLAALSATVRERLDALGVAYDRKRFVAHVSLLRGARALAGHTLPAPGGGVAPAALGRCRIHLVASELLPAGSRYRWIGAPARP